MRLILAFVAAALIGWSPLASAATELTFYYPIAVGGPLTKVIDGYAAEFEKANPGVKVKPIYAGNYDDARIKALAAQTSEPKWNFNKYVVSADGKSVKHFESRVTPESPEFIAAVESVL